MISAKNNEGGYSNNILQREKMVFLRPRSQYEVYDHKIWGEKTSDDPFQVSNGKFLGGWACGQHELTKVTKVWKKRYFLYFNHA